MTETEVVLRSSGEVTLDGYRDASEILVLFGRIWCEKAVRVTRRYLAGRHRDVFTKEEVRMIVVLEEVHVAVNALAAELRVADG